MIKLIKRLGREWKWLLLTFVMVVGQGITMLVVPNLMSSLINNGIVITDGVANINYTYILTTGAYMLLVSVLTVLFAIAAGFFSSKVVMNYGGSLRSDIFGHVESFTTKEFSKFGSASLITRTTNDVTQTQNVLYMLMRFGLMIPIMFVGGIFFTMSKSMKASAALLVAIPLLVGLAAALGVCIYKMFEKMQTRIDGLTLVMRENLSGVRVIRAFNREESEYQRFDKANSEVKKIGTKANQVMAYMVPCVNLIINLTVIAVIFIIANDVRLGNVNASEIGNMLAIIEFVNQIMMSIIMVAMIFIMVPRASASAKRINEVLDTKPSIIHSGGADKTLGGVVSFRNVGYKLDNAEGHILQDISFDANVNEVVGIIGSTGSGKTTLMRLLPRLYDSTEGEITFDGVNIKDIDLEVLRGQIGYVPQRSLLFRGTIATNLQFGKEDATEDEMNKACEIAQAANFVASKNGLATEVEQGGANFSGGQKQRLAIARALVRKPKLYVFDDSFSALDNSTDKALRAALRENVDGAVTFIIASRIGTIADADKILVLDEGKLVGEGKHKDLLVNCQVYREIASSQLSKEELENA